MDTVADFRLYIRVVETRSFIVAVNVGITRPSTWLSEWAPGDRHRVAR
jgi:hypothetical protein